MENVFYQAKDQEWPAAKSGEYVSISISVLGNTRSHIVAEALTVNIVTPTYLTAS